MADVLDERNTDPRPTRSSRRRWLWLVIAAVVAVAAVVLFWFQPQKLFIDERVEEAIPTATPSTGSTAPGAAATFPASSPDPPEPIEQARGEFVSLDHGTTGVVRVLELADGRRVVRLEGLDTDNGPDLYVYVGANPAGGDEGAFDDDFVNLGRLKGNQGDQNYDLPSDADLDRHSTVVIWCDRFDSAFGAADLVST